MAEQSRLAVIVNRAANKGGAARRWPAIDAQLKAHLGPFQPLFTEAPGHATELARAAVAEGARRIVAVGDGRVNKPRPGLRDARAPPPPPAAALGPVPAGTANELCRALGHLDHPA